MTLRNSKGTKKNSLRIGRLKDFIMHKFNPYQLIDVKFFNLINKATKRDLQLEKMKTLHKMKKILDKN